MAPKVWGASVAAEPIAVLQPLREGDVEAVAHWYDNATVLAGERCSLSDLLDPADLRVTLRQAQGERVFSSARGEPVEPRGG